MRVVLLRFHFSGKRVYQDLPRLARATKDFASEPPSASLCAMLPKSKLRGPPQNGWLRGCPAETSPKANRLTVGITPIGSAVILRVQARRATRRVRAFPRGGSGATREPRHGDPR